MYLQGKEREDKKMTVGTIVFVGFIFVWLGIAFMCFCKIIENSEGVNWWGFIWMGIAPFIPLVAKFCGLL